MQHEYTCEHDRRQRLLRAIPGNRLDLPIGGLSALRRRYRVGAETPVNEHRLPGLWARVLTRSPLSPPTPSFRSI